MPPAPVPPRADDSPVGRRLFVPRALVLLAAAWIFFAWISLFGLHPPVQPQSASYGPAIRMLFTVLGVGIAIGWPLLRLSGAHSTAPLRQCLLDAAAVFVLVQVAIWPLRLVTSWTVLRTAVLDAGVLAALVQTGAILSIFLGSRRAGMRTAGMAIFVALAGFAAAGELLARDLAVEPTSPPGLLVPLSAPALLSHLALPRSLEPTAGDLGLVVRSGWTAGAAMALALLVAATRAIAARSGRAPRNAAFDRGEAIR